MLMLYSYFRSSAAYRVRIALNLKGIEYATTAINLLKGEQKTAAYLAVNRQGLLPSLRVNSEQTIVQSTAILEWLEEAYTESPLLPRDFIKRAHVRGLCSMVACDIHPLNNLRVQHYLKQNLAVDQTAKQKWLHHWMGEGFSVIESELAVAPYALTEKPGMLDVYLIPQVFNALRFDLDMGAFPNIMAVYQACNQLAAFQKAAPENQPDVA